jgi:hypothetical protein
LRSFIRTGPGKLAAAIFSAVVASAVSYFVGPGFWERVEGWIGTADPPVQVQVITDLARFDSEAAHYPDYVLTRAIEDVPAPPDENATDARWAWAHGMGGVDANTTFVRLVVESSSDETVILQNARVKVVERRAPLTRGVFITDDGRGAGQSVRYFEADLDANTFTYMGTSGGPEARFPLRVSGTEQEVFDLLVSTAACDCDWVVELEYTAGDDVETLTVKDGDKPFRTTAATAYGERSDGEFVGANWAPSYIWFGGEWTASRGGEGRACGPLRVGDRVAPLLGTGAGADCDRATALMGSYFERAASEGQGNGAFVEIDEWTCAMATAGETEASGRLAQCTGGGDDVVMAVDPAQATRARLIRLEELAQPDP